MRPRASNFSSALPRVLLGGATSATRPSRSSTSMGALIFADGIDQVAAFNQRGWISIRAVVLAFLALSTSSTHAASESILRPLSRRQPSSNDPCWIRANPWLILPFLCPRQNCHARGDAVVNFVHDH